MTLFAVTILFALIGCLRAVAKKLRPLDIAFWGFSHALIGLTLGLIVWIFAVNILA